MKKRTLLIIIGTLLVCSLTVVLYFKYSIIFFQQTSVPSLSLSFLDIGQGDATFVRFPDSTTMLIDCARDARVLEALARAMQFHERRIDILVLTHPDEDHFGGCSDVLQRFSVGSIVYTGFKKKNSFFQAFEQEIQYETEQGAKYIRIDTPQKWIIASTTVQVLFPDKAVEDTGFESNDTSIVMKLEYGASSVLLTGDAEQALETYLVETYGSALSSNVLKIGHHGSDTSSVPEFLEYVKPEHAIISAGVENSYGHPSGRVLKRLQKIGSTVWRTDLQGDILATITTSTVHVENHETI